MTVWNSTAYGMLYGTLLTFGYAALQGLKIQFEWTAIYVVSLLYLVVFGSVIAFGSYLTLIGRIGPGRAAYTSVVFPVVAVLVSVLFEGYQITLLALIAIALGESLETGSHFPSPRSKNSLRSPESMTILALHCRAPICSVRHSGYSAVW